MTHVQGTNAENTASRQATELLNHALRLEYAGVTHLPRLNHVTQSVFPRYCISALIDKATEHAVRLAATIRELGGEPVWRVWSPPYGGSIVRLFEMQLERERTCRCLYSKAADLLAGSLQAEQCHALSRDEDYHIEMVKDILAALAQGDESEPVFQTRNKADNQTSDSTRAS